jgi:hypothetical protein
MPKGTSEFVGAERSANKTARILGVADQEALWELIERPVIKEALREYVSLVIELRKVTNVEPKLSLLRWKGLLILSRKAAVRPLLITDSLPKSCRQIHPRKLHVATNLHLIYKVIRHASDVFNKSRLLDTQNPQFSEQDLRSAYQLLRFYWVSGPRNVAPETQEPNSNTLANVVQVVEPRVLNNREDPSEDLVESAPA